MKEITLRIPEQRLDFFMALSKQLGFETVEGPATPTAHQEEVKKRIKSGQSAQMDLWQESRKKLTFNG
ncbi:MAG: hypothetical protein AAFP88_02165 [Bacteroidota bacterium]